VVVVAVAEEVAAVEVVVAEEDVGDKRMID
jgi:hypothetical protein